MISRLRSAWLSGSAAAGLLAIFVGERLIGTGTTRGVLFGVGVALVLAALAARLVRLARLAGDARRAEGLLALLTFGLLLAVACYLLQSDWGLGSSGWPRLAVALAVLVPVIGVGSGAPLLLAEIAYASMHPPPEPGGGAGAPAPVVELGRVRGAVFSGLGLAGALIFAFAAVYVATERDVKVDLSYARASRPGPSTRKIVEQLEEPVEVSLFFPPANEVRDVVEEYFSDLTGGPGAGKLHLSRYDHDVDRTRAKELGVTGNGAVVFQKGGRKEQLVIGQRLESARNQLKALDEEVHKRLVAVTRPRQILYFVTGHGERGETKEGPNDQRSTLAMFKQLLRDQNEELRTLGAADGLASEVPADAGAVLIVGPTQPFLKEELEALVRYAQRGGRLLIAVEPSPAVELRPLLPALGVQVLAGELANDQVLIRLTRTVSDNANLAIQSFPSHPAVTSLNQLAGRVFVAAFGAAPVEALPDRDKALTVDVLLRAHKETWADLNGDLLFQPQGEQRKPWALAVAVSSKLAGAAKDPEAVMRAVVAGDADLFSDATVGLNRGNAFFAVDVVRWLLGEDSIAGAVNSEADVPIEHTKKQDVAWFYSTLFGVPALVLALGVVLTRRRGRKARVQPVRGEASR